MEEESPRENASRPALRRPVRQYAQEIEEPQERISKIMGGALIVAALSIDLFEMLLEWLGIGVFGLSTLLSICASVGFWIWFKMLSVEFSTSPKKFGTMLTTSILEVVPGLDALGGFIWTIGIAATVYMIRKEDKGGGIIPLSGAVTHVLNKKTTRRNMLDVIE